MVRLIRTEMVKQMLRPRTWVALGFVTIVPIIIADRAEDQPAGPRQRTRR